jgi:high-affinity iron transporter
MLVSTGVLLGFVLLVMVGESVQEMQLAGWLPTHSIGMNFPGWTGLWLATFPTVEGLVAQGAAAAVVIGSYYLAEHVRVRRPRERAEREQQLVPAGGR